MLHITQTQIQSKEVSSLEMKTERCDVAVFSPSMCSGNPGNRVRERQRVGQTERLVD